MLMQWCCNAVFRVVHQLKEHPDGWRVEVLAPAGLCADLPQLREFQTWSGKTSKSWREAR